MLTFFIKTISNYGIFKFEMRALVSFLSSHSVAKLAELLLLLPAILEPKVSYLNGTEERDCLKVCEL